MKQALAILRLILSRPALQAYVELCALGGIYFGLSEIHRPTAIVVVSSLVLAASVFAKTRSLPQ
jgi:hypothetical protein